MGTKTVAALAARDAEWIAAALAQEPSGWNTASFTSAAWRAPEQTLLERVSLEPPRLAAPESVAPPQQARASRYLPVTRRSPQGWPADPLRAVHGPRAAAGERRPLSQLANGHLVLDSVDHRSTTVTAAANAKLLRPACFSRVRSKRKLAVLHALPPLYADYGGNRSRGYPLIAFVVLIVEMSTVRGPMRKVLDAFSDSLEIGLCTSDRE